MYFGFSQGFLTGSGSAAQHHAMSKATSHAPEAQSRNSNTTLPRNLMAIYK